MASKASHRLSGAKMDIYKPNAYECNYDGTSSCYCFECQKAYCKEHKKWGTLITCSFCLDRNYYHQKNGCAYGLDDGQDYYYTECVCPPIHEIVTRAKTF
jgi:hypothetical protein